MSTELVVADQHAEEAASLLAIIGNAALNPQVDVEKMRALLELKERIDANDAKKLFHAAMIAAQEEMRPIMRDRINPSTKTKYATLECIERAIRPVYTKHGFVLSFNSREGKEGMITMCCTCMHRGGFTKEYELSGALDSAGPSGTKNKTGIQAAGSTVSYLRRYILLMVFNLVLTDEDNDGQDEAYITQEQLGKLEDLISESGMTDSDKDAFKRYMSVDTVSHILPRDFAKAHNALLAKYKKSKGGQ